MPPRKKPIVTKPYCVEDHINDLEKAFLEKGPTGTLDKAYVPEPSYVLEPGTAVEIGSLVDTRIERVLDGGKYYVVSKHDTGLQYGRPYDNGRVAGIWTWMSITPLAAIQNTKLSAPLTHDNWISTDIDGLLGRLYSFGINSDPDYQRGYVWTLADKQKLIKSILQRYDIGKMVFLKEPYSTDKWYFYEILDGKQRLNAIQEYYEGRFVYEGYTFQQLSNTDKLAFRDTRIQYVDVAAEKLTESHKLHLFLSVNATGVQQSKEHMANIERRYHEALAKEAGNVASK